MYTLKATDLNKKMKSIILLIILIFASSNLLFSQSYLGWANKQVNIRKGPGKEFPILNVLNQGDQLFIISSEAENDFINVIDIKTNIEGYVNKTFIKLGEEVPLNNKGFFTPNGESTSFNSEIEIFNNTNIELTLRLNSLVYYFKPKEKRNIILDPGDYNYRASAPGVIPSIGVETMQKNTAYTWQFYIVTERAYHH